MLGSMHLLHFGIWASFISIFHIKYEYIYSRMRYIIAIEGLPFFIDRDTGERLAKQNVVWRMRVCKVCARATPQNYVWKVGGLQSQGYVRTYKQRTLSLWLTDA